MAENRKTAKKCTKYFPWDPGFLPKRADFGRRNLQVAAVVRVINGSNT
jgi:hypothetical protein